MPIKVLVADDSPTIRRRAAATLSEAGYEVTCVDSGEAAWALLEAGDPCAVLLCDILMPGMDGYELCRLVKSDARLANLPVLLLRGTFEPWDQAKAENVGADGFITKPFDANALLSTLSEVVAELVPTSDASVGATMSEGSVLAAMAAPASQAAPQAEAALASADPLGDPLADPLGGGDDSPLAAPPPAGAEPLALGDDPFSLGDEPPTAPMPALSAPTPAAAPIAVLVPPTPARSAPAPEPAPAPRPEPVRASAPAPAPPAAAPAPPAAAPTSASVPAGDMDDAMLDRLAARVIARLTTQQIEKIAWEVVPDVAEALIKKRLFEIESKLASE